MKMKIVAGLLVLLAGGLAFSMGWKGSPEPNVNDIYEQAYDPAKEMAFEGKVLRIEPEPCVAMPVSSYHVHLQLGKENVEVHLGPCWYIPTLKPALQVGDTIKGIGSEASWKSGDRRVIIAREIHRGDELLRLRDATGKGLWRK